MIDKKYLLDESWTGVKVAETTAKKFVISIQMNKIVI